MAEKEIVNCEHKGVHSLQYCIVYMLFYQVVYIVFVCVFFANEMTIQGYD